MDFTATRQRSLKLAAVAAQRYAESNMIAAVSISRPTALVFNQTTGALVETSAAPLYVGKARITPMSGPLQFSVGDEPQFYSAASVSIPLAAPVPRIDDVLTVTAHPDPAVVGRVFRITDVTGAGEIPDCRRLSVVGVQHSRTQSYP